MSRKSFQIWKDSSAPGRMCSQIWEDLLVSGRMSCQILKDCLPGPKKHSQIWKDISVLLKKTCQIWTDCLPDKLHTPSDTQRGFADYLVALSAVARRWYLNCGPSTQQLLSRLLSVSIAGENPV